MSCLRPNPTRRIRDLSTLIGLSWHQARPVPVLWISGRRFDNRNKLTILDRTAHAVVITKTARMLNPGQNNPRIVVAPPHFVWIGPTASRDQEMSTLRSNSLSSDDVRRSFGSLLSPRSLAQKEGAASVMLAGGGECAINQQCGQQDGPFDHVAMIARPYLDAGASGRIYHGKQNVNRRHPPGRNQGGGDSR